MYAYETPDHLCVAVTFDTDRLSRSTLLWSTMPDGRFVTALRTEDEGDVTRYNLVLNWSPDLTRRMKAARGGWRLPR